MSDPPGDADPDADDAEVRLTEHAQLHGCSCKVGQSDLDGLLREAGVTGDDPGLLLGVGDDAAAVPIGRGSSGSGSAAGDADADADAGDPGQALVATVDYFTPVVDDPYEFGRIAACNAASDAFAVGAVGDLSALVVLGVPRAVTEVAPRILEGIADGVADAGGVVVGGHTVTNPWPLAGGAVFGAVDPDALLSTRNASPGDRLLLTKPLGTQAACGALRVLDGEFGPEVRAATDRSVERVGAEAVAWMTTPNRRAALAARGTASAATDVTGFGLLGQARVLADRSEVGVRIDRLPVIAGTPALSRLFGYGLDRGESAETSGGLLLAVPPDRHDELRAALDDRDVFHRTVGQVVDGEGARLADPTVEAIARE